MDELTSERYVLRPHVFIPGRHRTYGKRICESCGSLEGGRIHKVPSTSDEQAKHEARRTGERA